MQNNSVHDSVLDIGIAIGTIMILGEGVGKDVDAESSGIRYLSDQRCISPVLRIP